MTNPTVEQTSPPPVVPPSCTSEPDDEGPEFIGFYRVKKTLGKGGGGIVFLAEDEKLNRLVAIKVPSPNMSRNPKDIEAFLQEPRNVAGLEHPNIVPVYHADSTGQFPCYV